MCEQPLHLLAGECALCQIMYSLAGLFWRNNLGFASVIPSEKTASTYTIFKWNGSGGQWFTATHSNGGHASVDANGQQHTTKHAWGPWESRDKTPACKTLEKMTSQDHSTSKIAEGTPTRLFCAPNQGSHSPLQLAKTKSPFSETFKKSFSESLS